MKHYRPIGLFLVFLLWTSTAFGASVTLDLSWSVTNTPTVPATSFRIEENVAGTWGVVDTVAAPTMAYQLTGRTTGLYTFRVIPVANGLDGTPSNTTTCGAVAPDTTVSITCSATVVP